MPVTPRKRRAAARNASYVDPSDTEFGLDLSGSGSGDSASEPEYSASPSKKTASGSRSALKRSKNLSGSAGKALANNRDDMVSPSVSSIGATSKINAKLQESIKKENDQDHDNGPDKSPNKSPIKTPIKFRKTQTQPADFGTPVASSPLRKLLQETESYFDEEAGDQALFLDGYEGYFDQHKVREKISTTPFTRAPRLEYQEFTSYVHDALELNKDGRQFLRQMYIKMFPQWYFELEQGFGLLFYGVGSKRELLMSFVGSQIDPHIPVLVVNGYNPATTFKEILVSAVNILIKDEDVKAELPKNPLHLLEALLNYLEKTASEKDEDPIKLVLVIHNLDGPSIRTDKVQILLSKLASASQIRVVASVDHINASHVFDAAKLSEYNFLWHDLTTYELYTVETSFDDPLAVGRDRSAVASKGVEYVLASLTDHAKRLYKLLLLMQIDKMSQLLAKGDNNTVGSVRYGIETKIFYRKCGEELIVSNDVNFRTMLSEFIDHKMIVLSKDKAGIEIVYVPFTKDACEGILKDMF